MDNRTEKLPDDFDMFLSKVKEVGSIIKDISSSDVEISNKGVKRADDFLRDKKELETSTADEDGIVTVYSKSSLNKNVLDEIPDAPDFSNMSAEEFRKTVEKDANERCRRNAKK